MSHTTTIPCSIRDLNALKTATAKMSALEFREGKKQFKSYEKQFPCSHAIGLNNGNGYGYEVGVVAKNGKEGEYELKFDSFDSALAEVVGFNCENLIQGYTQQLVIQEMPFGWDYKMERQSNGDLVMDWSH